MGDTENKTENIENIENKESNIEDVIEEGVSSSGDDRIETENSTKVPESKGPGTGKESGTGKNSKLKKYNKKKMLKIELIVLVVMLLCLGLSVYRFLSIRPGWVDESTIEATERTATEIEIEWAEARNAKSYQVSFVEQIPAEESKSSETDSNNSNGQTNSNDKKESTDKTNSNDKTESSDETNSKNKSDSDIEPIIVETEELNARAQNLKEGTEYQVEIKAYTEDGVEGIPSRPTKFCTKKRQNLEGATSFFKLTSSKNFEVANGAMTKLACKSSNTKVATVDDKGVVDIKGSGSATITVQAEETDDYLPAKKTVKLTVIPSLERNAGGAAFGVVHSIGPSDVKTVMRVYCDGRTPQSLAFTGKKYIIAFGDWGSQRIVSYNKEGSGRSVAVPSHNLGHPNGFTYCNKTELCYSVRGKTTQIDTYNPSNGAFGTTRMPYQAAGICYDRVDKVIYTTSQTGIRVYSGDGRFIQKKLIYNIKHPMFIYTQDSCGHAGFVFRCISGSNKHAQNYIDMYRVSDSKYLGSIRVNGLGELESAIVDNEGYLELLVNSGTDYIYRTNIRVEDLR